MASTDSVAIRADRGTPIRLPEEDTDSFVFGSAWIAPQIVRQSSETYCLHGKGYNIRVLSMVRAKGIKEGLVVGICDNEAVSNSIVNGRLVAIMDLPLRRTNIFKKEGDCFYKTPSDILEVLTTKPKDLDAFVKNKD